VSPREESAHEYLLSASRILRAEELHEKALDPFLLQAEFFVSPLAIHPTVGRLLHSHCSLVQQTHVWSRLMSPSYHLSHHLGQALPPLNLNFLS
jgi:hypothetical protein